MYVENNHSGDFKTAHILSHDLNYAPATIVDIYNITYYHNLCYILIQLNVDLKKHMLRNHIAS